MLLALPMIAVLAGCACHCPALRTAQQAAELDFSQRADGALLSCTASDYRVRVRLVRS